MDDALALAFRSAVDLLPSSAAATARVLVYGRDSQLAARELLSGAAAATQADVFFASDEGELAALDAQSVDVLLVLRLSADARLPTALVRVVRDDGVVCGVGVLEVVEAASLRRLRAALEGAGLLVRVLREIPAPERADGCGVHVMLAATKDSVAPVAPVVGGEPVVVSGISVGLPNGECPDTAFFSKDNVFRLFRGENCISLLTEHDKQRILDQKVVQVVKVEGKRVQRQLSSPHEVLQVASKLARFDLRRDYGVPAHVAETLDVTYELALAAGIEALQDAGIDVVRRNAEGVAEIVPLPEELQDDTGVIFASSFPSLDSCVQSMGRAFAGGDYDRKLMFKLLVMANNQLAELIKARGPNTHVNSACSSTTQAIAVAEDWLRLGRCRRVVVIGADNATGPNLLPLIGTGFLALGAASTAPSVATAALPFDQGRNGMILGMGSVGLVLETQSACLERAGGRPRAELLGSHFRNSAYHASLMCGAHIAQELDRFMSAMEQRHGLSRSYIAENAVYFSHETSTCANGGCAKAEVDALERAFGAAGRAEILMANTKGFTGHPMGVGIEDAVAVASLEHGLVPPIANLRCVDPALGQLNLASAGGAHSRTLALRFAAGFGSQFTFLLFRKWAPPPPPRPQPLRSACAASLPLGAGVCGAADDEEADATTCTREPSRTSRASDSGDESAADCGRLSGSAPPSPVATPAKARGGERVRRQMHVELEDACSVM